jgi:methyl-accepting chemotaxis protein
VLLNKGATPLDLNQIAAIRAKLEDRDRSVGQTLMLAQDYGGRALDPALAEALTLGGQEIRAVIELTDLTFLGMSPDWDVPHEKYQARMLQATEAQRALTRKIAETVVQALRQRSDGLTTFLVLVFAGSFLMLLVGGVLMVRSIRSIVRPLQSSLVQAQKLAEGDLSHSFASQEQNEVGRMLGALETARSRLNGLLAEVQTASSKVAMASDEIRHGNQDLSGRTERTAQQLQNTSQFMRQLEADVNSAASASQEASVLSAQASEVAQLGGRAMADVMATMDSISHSSTRIRDIIGVIDGIAFQTNILALNAAVEAARAGEQGRGFAVVAAEVRMLAQRSSSAAQEIRGLIQDSVQDVKRGVELVKSAGATSTDTVTQVQRMRDVVAQITDSAVRQSEDLRHLVGAVSELDLMTQQNAAMVEESSAATHSMADQAALLQGLVQRFRLDTEGRAQQRLALEPGRLQSRRLAITG